MSQYIHIFIRNGNDFLPLWCLNGKYNLGEILSKFAEWEKVVPLTVDNLDRCKDLVDSKIGELIETRTSYEESIKIIPTFDNNLDDKCEKIFELKENIRDINLDIQEVEYDKHMLSCMRQILDSIHDITTYSEDEEFKKKFDVNKYLYIGLETGDKITLDMVEE